MILKFKINYFFIIILLFVVSSCKDEKVSDLKLTAKEIYDKNVNNTVTVVTPNGIGSGFFIDKNLIVTNYHVIEGENSAEVILNNSDKKIKVIGYLSIDKVNDLVLLKIDYSNNSYLDIEKKIPSPGDKVFAIGSPIGLNKTISEGIVSGIRSLENNKLIQITTPISHGSSGCPIINEKGKLIAVAVSGIDGASNIGFCIPSNYVNSLIDFKESYSKEISSLNGIKFKDGTKNADKKTANEVSNKPIKEEKNKLINVENNKPLEERDIVRRYLGKHLFNAFSIDYTNSFGTATIKYSNGKYLFDAFQKNEKGNFIKLKGEIFILNINKFIFKGNMYVNNSGYSSAEKRVLQTCESNIDLIFEASGGSVYWREQVRSSNGCYSHTSDLDIFFKTDPKYKETNYP